MLKVCVVVLAVALAVATQLSWALECRPDTCKDVVKPDPRCQGGIILGGGPCGCTDTCAKVEGETCVMPEGMMESQGSCDLTLHCVHLEGLAPGTGVCRNTRPDVDLGYHPHHHYQSKRLLVNHTPRTACEQRRLSSMISMVVYEGQWFAKCDDQGQFLPMQCDNTHHCFCVDTETGKVMEGTKVLGTAYCPAPTSA